MSAQPFQKKHRQRHRAAGLRLGWVCVFCRQPVQCPTCFPGTRTPATIDHIKPKSKGGTDALFNLQIACAPCNFAKADRKHPENARSAR